MEIRNVKEVLSLLVKAQEFSKSFCGGSSHHFKSTAEFREALRESIILLKSGDTSQLKQIYQWFLPTSSWYAVIGPDGYNLGKQISEKLNEIIRKDIIERWNLAMN